jgi:hypothetical protein
MILDTEQLVTYINLELKKNVKLSVNKICDKIGIKQSTVKSKLHKSGYSFNPEFRKYEKNNVDDKEVNQVIEVLEPVQTIDNTDMMTQVINFDDSSMTFNNQIKSNLIGLAENYDRIMGLLNNDKNMTSGINIELPIETVDNFRTTVRVNNVVWDNFKDFCKDHKEFTQRDLLSAALLEYINNHK